MQSVLKNKILLDNTFAVGTADLNGLLDKKWGEFRYGIAIIKRLDDKIIDEIENGPTLEYYHYYNRINSELAEKAREIRMELKKIRINAIVIEPTISATSEKYKDYLQNLTVDVSHKMIATRAGLGWIGKTDLFISERFGPRVRLASLLTDRKPEFLPKPINESKCGNCNICVEKCPAQAATGALWNIHIHRDTFFNAQKCRLKCGQLAKERLHVDRRICGICVSVCPIGKKNRTTKELVTGKD